MRSGAPDPLYVSLSAIDVGVISSTNACAQGGRFPIAFAAAIFVLMSTWRTGRQALSQRLSRYS
jgi:K+ transporter